MCGPHWHEYLLYLPPEQPNDFNLALKHSQNHCMSKSGMSMEGNGRTSNTAHCMKYLQECLHNYIVPFCKIFLYAKLTSYIGEELCPVTVHCRSDNIP